ncbi:16S rRNA (cytosine(1402)-N(4))-methyltransferase RsmH [Candidatus Margulisiibacteriota bacterium]
MTDHTHIPVLLNEAVSYLNPQKDQIMVDATLGLGGHAEAILKKGAKVIGIDRDIEAITIAKNRLSKFEDKFTVIKDNFSNIKNALNTLNIRKVDGILLDLGLSSLQIDSPERGFSLRKDGPLDMRMDCSLKISASDIINTFSQEELEQTIKELGEERLYKRIVRGLIKQREEEKIDTTFKLVDAIKASIPRMNPKNETNIITRVFQAIRIKVNNELESLKVTLEDSIDLLNSGGRIVMISYHSLEDRIVKNIFKTGSKDCLCPPRQPKCTCDHRKILAILTKKPVTPGEKELEENPRSRSAKLRAAEKV